MLTGFVIHLFGTNGAGTWSANLSPEPPPHWHGVQEGDLAGWATYNSSQPTFNGLAAPYISPDIIPPILESATTAEWFTGMDPVTGKPAQFQGVSNSLEPNYNAEQQALTNSFYVVDKINNLLQPQADGGILATGTISSDTLVSCPNLWSLDIHLTTLPVGVDNWWAPLPSAKYGLVVPTYASETTVLYGEAIFFNFPNTRLKIPQL